MMSASSQVSSIIVDEEGGEEGGDATSLDATLAREHRNKMNGSISASCGFVEFDMIFFLINLYHVEL